MPKNCKKSSSSSCDSSTSSSSSSCDLSTYSSSKNCCKNKCKGSCSCKYELKCTPFYNPANVIYRYPNNCGLFPQNHCGPLPPNPCPPINPCAPSYTVNSNIYYDQNITLTAQSPTINLFSLKNSASTIQLPDISKSLSSCNFNKMFIITLIDATKTLTINSQSTDTFSDNNTNSISISTLITITLYSTLVTDNNNVKKGIWVVMKSS